MSLEFMKAFEDGSGVICFIQRMIVSGTHCLRSCQKTSIKLTEYNILNFASYRETEQEQEYGVQTGLPVFCQNGFDELNSLLIFDLI